MGNKTLAAQVSMVIVTLMWAAGYITAKMALDGGMTPNVYTSFRFLRRCFGNGANLS